MLLGAASIGIDIGNEPLRGHSRLGLIVLGACLLSFVFIRISTRLMRNPKVTWWPGSVSAGGVHVHHLVFGIVLMIAAGFIGITFEHQSPWTEIIAALFGIGVGLTLDEFALWLHLEDVYWSEEGRQSVDALVLALLLGGLLAIGATPFEFGSQESIVTVLSTVLINLAFCAVALSKGKRWTGVCGVFIPLIAQVGAIRLARPGSWWSRRFYIGRSDRKLARSMWRDQRVRRHYRGFQDLIGGAPNLPSPLTGAPTPPTKPDPVAPKGPADAPDPVAPKGPTNNPGQSADSERVESSGG